MTARRAAVLVVAVLVLLAGCTDGGNPGGPGGGDTDGGDAGSGDGGGSDGASGGDGTTDGDGFAVTDRESALRDAGSFTATWRYSGTDIDAERGSFGVTHQVDLENERSLTTWETSDGTETEGWEQFHADGVTYNRYGSGEEAVYTSAQTDPDLLTASLGYGGLYSAADTDGLVARGQETFDGVSVTRYELAESATVPWFAAGGAGGAGSTDPDRLEEVDWTYSVLVDGDGLARHETWGWTGRTADDRTVTFEAEYSITAVGSTSVADPAWLPAAQEASD